MSDTQVELLDATMVDPDELDALLRQVYSAEKSNFLRQHGAWHHRGNHNRFLIRKDGELAGYCAVMPSEVSLKGQTEPVMWWIDLFVLSTFRGQGLQSRLDLKVRDSSRTLLGIPNELATEIHRKHGWGVRDDYHVMLLPLTLRGIPAIQRSTGWKGNIVRGVARLMQPLAWVYSVVSRPRRGENSWQIANPDVTMLAEVFARHAEPWITTYRSTDYLRWRFLENPQRDQLSFFVAGSSPDSPSLVAISRTLPIGRFLVTRLLDIFGDLHQKQYLDDLLGLVINDAIAKGAAQLTAVATNSPMQTALKSHRFVRVAPFRFCWISEDREVMRLINEGPCHWCLADSDSDSSV